jgi:phage/plasmid-like protein (TIGR03299 family)
VSRETLEWLNVMTLIGDTEVERSYESWTNADGQAWHYRAAMQGEEENHYPGAIPVEDVERRLFGWEPVAVSPMVASYVSMTADGVETVTISDGTRQMIVRPRGALGPEDPGAILGVFKAGYKVHSFREWLVRNIQSILDDSLHVSSAGLLREGAQAWVSVSIPNTITTPEGVEFRPVLTGATSLDGSLATGYSRSVLMPICDNSLAVVRAENKDQTIKFRHTTNSLNRIGEAREKLAVSFAAEAIDEVAKAFSAEVAELTNTTVTDAQWAAFMDAHELTTLVDAKGNAKQKASRTHAMNRRAEFEQLYRYDDRCKAWQGTAFGVLQTVNTHATHVRTVQGMSRPLRNADRMVTGGVDKLDGDTLAVLDRVLSAA